MNFNLIFFSSNFYINSINLVISLVIITLIIVIEEYIWVKPTKYKDKNSSFFIENHPFISTGILFCIGYSLLIPRINSIFLINQKLINIFHAILSGVGIVLSCGPLITLFNGLLRSQIVQHFYSIHVWFGGIALVLLFIQFLFSIIYYLFASIKKPKEDLMNKFYGFHKNMGKTVFALIALSYLLGISEEYSIYGEEFPLSYDITIFLPNLLSISVVVFTSLTLYLVFSQSALQSSIDIIRIKGLAEKQRFISRVIEKQKKRINKSQNRLN